MSNENIRTYSFPYFASKENQSLYIMIPVPYQTIVKQMYENRDKVENYSTEEEILPDFRCKICFATIFNYCDFKIHLQDHEKVTGEILKTSFALENDRVEGWKEENCTSKLDPSNNIENGAITGNYNFDFNLNLAEKNVNLMPKNKTPSSEIVSDSILEGYRRPLSSNKLFVSSNNSIIPLSNVKMSNCSKSEEALNIQKQILDTEFKKKSVINSPLIKTADEFHGYMVTNNFSNDTDDILSPAKDSFEKSISDIGIMSSPLTNKLHSEKELLATSNAPVIEPDSVFSKLQPQLVKLNEKKSTEFEDLNLDAALIDNSSGKRINRIIDKLKRSASKSQLPVDCDSDISTYSEYKMSTGNSTKTKAVGYMKSITPSFSLETADVSEHVVSILKPTTTAKENMIRSLHCGKMFESEFLMTKHLIQPQETKFIYCVLCKSKFSSRSSLQKHLSMFHCNTKDRRACPQCDYRCFQTSDLQKHIARRHTKDFKYKCSYCKKGFVAPKELRNHFARKHL